MSDLDSLQALEALRAGVPSRAALRLLGTQQPAIEERFIELLGGTSAGLLIGGGFGAGKSHLLEHLAALGHAEDFVVSRVVVGKDMPLHDTTRLLKRIAATACGPGDAPGTAIEEAAAALDETGRQFHDLYSWALATLDPRFAVTLQILARTRGGSGGDLTDGAIEAITQFWSGEPLQAAPLRVWMKACGIARQRFETVPAPELSRQRLQLLGRLFQAVGRGGLVVLVDEAELIGRYPVLGRAKAYAALADLLGGKAGGPLRVVVAMTDDFAAAVLVGKRDREVLPDLLRSRGTDERAELAARAVIGMRLISKEMRLLRAPDDEDLARAYVTLRALHGRAYDWQPPDVASLERLGATRMRQHVRAWINAWDLIRADSTYQPSTVLTEVAGSWNESDVLEG